MGWRIEGYDMSSTVTSMATIKATGVSTRLARGVLVAGTALILTGCGGSLSNLDWDLRPSDRFNTTEGARAATAARPPADSRGVISYPGYQVVVAQRGDSVETIASRLNISASELARHNAVQTDTTLRGGELLVLPSRIQDTGLSSGAITTTALTPATIGPEPNRHTVRRGETAFTIARL
jgi:LysM repeat protein